MKGHLAVLGADLADARRSGFRVPHRGDSRRARTRNVGGLTAQEWLELRVAFHHHRQTSHVAGRTSLPPDGEELARRIGEAVQLIREEMPGEAFAELLIAVLTGSDPTQQETAA